MTQTLSVRLLVSLFSSTRLSSLSLLLSAFPIPMTSFLLDPFLSIRLFQTKRIKWETRSFSKDIIRVRAISLAPSLPGEGGVLLSSLVDWVDECDPRLLSLVSKKRKTGEGRSSKKLDTGSSRGERERGIRASRRRGDGSVGR